MAISDAREELARIAKMRRDLPTLQARAIDAARAQGMTWRDIAHTLGVTERAVYKAHATRVRD